MPGPLDAKVIIVSDIEQSNAGSRLVQQFFPNARYEYLVDKDTKLRDLDHTCPQLESVSRLIEEAKPNLVLILGSYAAKHMIDKQVKQWRGSILFNGDQKYMISYHPRDAFKQNYSDENPGQTLVLFKTDMKKAVKFAEMDDYSPPNIELLVAPPFHVAMAELERLKSSPYLACDIETINKKSLCIDAISFSDSKYWGMSICIGRYNTEMHKFEYHYTWEETLMIWEKIKELLESPVPKIFQNGNFDMVVLDYIYHIRVANLVWDTMCAAHNLYCELPKDLGTLMSIYTDLPYHKHKIHGTHKEYLEYNAMDSVGCIWLFEAQRKEMLDIGCYHHYRTVTNPLISCLKDMQVAGVKIDTELRDRGLALEQGIMAEMKDFLNQIIPNFNPGSPKQMKSLLYDIFRFPVRYKKKSITTDLSTIMEFCEMSQNKYVRMVLLAVVVYKHAQHQAGVFKTPLIGDRMHCQYSAWGTETGRLNSGKSILRTRVDDVSVPVGTNLQNLKKGDHRRMIIGG